MKVRRSAWVAVATASLAASALAMLPNPATATSAPLAATAAAPAAASAEPLGDAAVDKARAHLRAKAGEYGLSAADVDALEVSSVVPSKDNGLTTVWFQQRYKSIPISNALLNVAVRPDGTVFRVASTAVKGAGARVTSSSTKISDVQAAQAAAKALGLRPTGSFESGDQPEGLTKARTLDAAGISSDPIPVDLAYQLTDKGELRLTWQLVINQLDGEHWWQMRMDAATGDEVDRADWVAEDSHNVYPFPTEAPSFGPRQLVSNPAWTTASPFGWNDTNGAAGAESTLTTGNNVDAYTDTDANNVPDTDSRPDGGASLVFNFPLDLGQEPSTYRPAAVSNLYYANNRIHDVMYRFGFNESSANFQVNNYGKGGAGNDAVNAEAQDGSGSNNANFGTPPEGQRPRMQMYTWTAPTPDRDGDFDNGIIIHEYGHGISNRLTGGGTNVSCLQNQEQGGEGWSDFYALALTQNSATEDAAGRGIGTYALNQPTSGPGIRTKKYSTDLAINDHTYDDIKTMVAPHGVGEVWATMLNDLYWALVGKYGYTGDLINGNGGNVRAIQLVTTGLKLNPCSPGFVDARDAILAADQSTYGGANRCLIWDTFARRGLGASASQGLSTSKTDGTQAFDVPANCNAVSYTASVSPDPIPGGSQATYSVAVTNNATTTQNGVSVSNEIGTTTTYVAGSATCGGDYDGGTRTVTFVLNLAVGATQTCTFKVTAQSSPVSDTTFSDDVDPDLSAWTVSHASGATDWVRSTTAANSAPGSAFADEPATVADKFLQTAAPVAVGSNSRLTFWQNRNMENGYDGGVVEVSTNGGSTWSDVGAAAFTENGYNATINGQFSSPIANRQAFSGNSNGWKRSVADLSAFAGQSVLIRFRAASDQSVGGDGWYVDDVSVGRVVNATNQITLINPGQSDQTSTLTTPIVAGAPTVPGAPAVTSSTPGAGQVSVAFSPPASDGGSPITQYYAQCVSTDGGVTSAKLGTASPLVVSGVSAGKSYRCRVQAKNSVGWSPYSGYGSTVSVPAAVPGAPSVTSSTPSPGTVTVGFNPPASNGGAAISQYYAQCVSTDGGVTSAKLGTASPLAVSGLTGEKSYRCRVQAKNSAGWGAYSGFGSTVSVPAATVPGTPSVTSSAPGPGQVTVGFSAPASDGGSPITQYYAQCVSTDGGGTSAKLGTGSPLAVTGLSGTKSYRCRVQAKNSAGWGPYSGYGPTVQVGASVPSAPSVTSSTAGAGQVTVGFSAPATNGGAAITQYYAQCVSSDGGVTSAKLGTASPLAVVGLTSGKTYRCRVQAKNSVGWSPYSAFGNAVTVS